MRIACKAGETSELDAYLIVFNFDVLLSWQKSDFYRL